MIARSVKARNLKPVNRTIWGIPDTDGPFTGSGLVEYSFGLPRPRRRTSPTGEQRRRSPREDPVAARGDRSGGELLQHGHHQGLLQRPLRPAVAIGAAPGAYLAGYGSHPSPAPVEHALSEVEDPVEEALQRAREPLAAQHVELAAVEPLAAADRARVDVDRAGGAGHADEIAGGAAAGAAAAALVEVDAGELSRRRASMLFCASTRSSSRDRTRCPRSYRTDRARDRPPARGEALRRI